jgi:hypothetical protein
MTLAVDHDRQAAFDRACAAQAEDGAPPASSHHPERLADGGTRPTLPCPAPPRSLSVHLQARWKRTMVCGIHHRDRHRPAVFCACIGGDHGPARLVERDIGTVAEPARAG